MRQGTYIALAVVALAAAACGGGGGGGSTPGTSALPATTIAPVGVATTPAASNTSPVPAGYARASFSITVPKASGSSSNARQTKVVSPSTQSITFTLMQQNGAGVTGSTPQTFGLTTSNSYCTTTAAGLTCTLQIDAPIGADLYLAQTYSGTAGNGSLTGSGAVALSVQQNANNNANLSLTGTVAAIYLAMSNTYLGQYVPLAKNRRPAVAATPVSSLQIFVIAVDQNGTMILNPSVYSSPITLQLFYPLGGSPDVTLQVVPGQEGGGTASTSANYGTVSVNSPSDVITATIINGVASASPYALVIGGIGSSAVIASPQPLPTSPPAGASYVEFGVYETTPTGIQVTDYYGNPIASLSDLSLTGDSLVIEEGGFYGNFTVTGCTGVTNFTLSNYGGYAYLSTSDVAVGSCAATISDGQGNTFTLPITVTTTAVVGQ